MAQPATTLLLWWWGEDEAPGLGRWLHKTIEAFQTATPGVRVKADLEEGWEVVDRFTKAAAARQSPDLQYFWNGSYHIENAWRGYIAPLEPLIPASELERMGSTPLSTYRGQTFRAGWYLIPVVWLVNRRILLQSGVDADAIPPRTWDDLLAQCEQVKAAGHVPIETGDLEGDFSVWWLTHFLVQQFDRPRDAGQLFLGGLDWRDPPHYAHWDMLKTVWEAGYINADAPTTDLWEAVRRFSEGQGAFTLASGPMFPACERALGDDVVVAAAPVAGGGALAGLPIIDTQGLGIASDSDHQEEAARFLRFLHRTEQLDRLWEELRLLPANTAWGGGERIAHPEYRKMWDGFVRGPATLYLPDLMPVYFHFEGMAPLGKRIMAGELDGAGAAAHAAEVTRQWRARTSDEVEHYRVWIEGLPAETPDRDTGTRGMPP